MNRKKIIIILPAIFLLIIFAITFSYAYWKLTYQATSVNKIVSSCFSMELTNEKNNIILDSAYPISDEKGKSLTPYSFTITNTCDLFASYTINLEMLEGTTLDSKYIKTMINSEEIINLNSLETTDPSIEGATESRVLFKGSLGSGDSTDYTLRIWMDSDTPPIEDTMNKIFQGKITVTAEVSTYSPVENGFTNLAEALLVNEYQTTSLDVAKNKITSKQEVDFSKTAPIIEWQILTSTTTQELNIIKADPSVVGTYNIAENAAKVLLGKSYSFDSTTGYYELEDTAYYNLNDLDYSSNNYYICDSSISVTTDNSLTYWDGTSCSVMYKINSLSSIINSTITLSGGDSVGTLKYTFNVYKYSEVEVESDKSDKGLYKDVDDYGDSYYYRGNVTNNYVKFGGFYWRFIRVNGDGSIRLLYAGNTLNAESSNLIIGTSQFNSVKNNPTYVGYMYSNTLDSSYEETISNDNNSTIKNKLDEWYKNNILDTGYASYIADSGFCNDRSVSINSSGKGATSNETTDYASYYRLVNNNPTFICSNMTNDLFTLPENTVGNGKLTYPIGLITIDELVYAGSARGSLNKMNYTYSSQIYWTMSPNAFSSYNDAAYIYRAGGDGSISNYMVTISTGVRPVINLKYDTEISGGIGTKNDPFIIK